MKKVSTEEFDRAFDAGEDITPHLDLDPGHAAPASTPAASTSTSPPGWSKASTPAPPTSASPARP